MNLKKLIKSCLYPFVYTYCSLPIFNDKNKMSVQEAERILKENHPRIKADIYANNKITKEYDLMIIVPAYNVEKYIKQCMESLLNQQTEYTYKIVIVNDGSTDNTGSILKKYEKNEKVQVINQENRGFSGARNRALENIIGKYIMFVDSDDMIYENSIQKLMEEITSHNYDILQGSYSIFSENSTEVKDVTLNNPVGFPWGKIIKSNVFNNLKFPTSYWYEDSIFEFIIYQLHQKTNTVKELVYKYRQNDLGITSTSKMNVKSIDTVWLTMELLDCMKDFGINPSNPQNQKSLINQVKTNQNRLRMLDEEIQKAGFCLISNVYKELFNSSMDVSLNRKSKLVAKLMRKNQFKRFKLLCKV